MENLHLKIEGPAGNEITILQGKAPDPLPLKAPQIINLSGDIHTVANFLKREVDGHESQKVQKDRAIVTVDKNDGTITMQLDPENYYGATIRGKLEGSEELKPFKINSEHIFGRESLLKQIRFSRLWFDNKEVHNQIVQNLSKITLKTETELQAANDRQGNVRAMIDQKVNKPDTWVSEFYLLIPIYKGFGNERIRVEICMDASATGMQFWLESPELSELMDGKKEAIFANELKQIGDFVTIFK